MATKSDKKVANAIIETGSVFLQNRYADEEVASSYAYPDGYSVKPVTEQIKVLVELFGLDGKKSLAFAENLPELPEGAEGWFAIPKWQTVASTYGEAVGKMLTLVAGNWRGGHLGEKYLRQSERTEQMFAKFCEQQEGDILVIPAQFGLRHRGRSVRRARVVFIKDEFGLGSFAVGCMLLTHPQREWVEKQLHIDCSGDESTFSDGSFMSAPLFDCFDGKLFFYTHMTSGADWRYGCVSGFFLG